MEYLTAVFCFIATCLILASIRGKNSAVAILFKSCIALVFFFVSMEEISWGQRIIGWETPEFMIGSNYQNETNFHNYLNPILDELVLILNLSMCIFLAGIRKVKHFIASKSGLNQLLPVMPSDNFQIFSLVFSFPCSPSLSIWCRTR